VKTLFQIIQLTEAFPWFDFHLQASGNLALKYPKDGSLSPGQFSLLGRWKPYFELF